MSRRALLLGWLLPLAASAAESAAPALPGIWKLEMKKFMASGEMYTEFFPGGGCEQTARVKLAGITHWAADRCTWKLENGTLSMTMTASSDASNKLGAVSTVHVDALKAEALTVSKDGKAQDWTRVAQWPDEFAAHKLGAAAAPPAAGEKH